jgi:murein DD-endopeptidase MepM/ murein hydrolase activator NlpD
MAKYYTIIVIDDKGSSVREALVSKRLLRFLAILSAIFVTFIGTGTYRYVHMIGTLSNNVQIVSELDHRQAKIESQGEQIRTFALRINELKSKLISLNEFEQKIRILANLEHKSDQATLFGTGGSAPDDIDASIGNKQDQGRLIREMHQQMSSFSQASTIQHNSFESLLKSLEDKKNVLAATPSLRPTQGWVTSDFGYRISPFTGHRELHKGLDIANREGTPIIAPANGIVTQTGPKALMGNMITVEHGYGIITRYGHVKEMLKKPGDRVKRGEIIALIGNTGRSTGPHLHYEVRLNGMPVDPTQYILD